MIMGLWILALPISACSFIVGKRFSFISPTHRGEAAAAAALCCSQEEGGWVRGMAGWARWGREADGTGRTAQTLRAEGVRALTRLFSCSTAFPPKLATFPSKENQRSRSFFLFPQPPRGTLA